MAVLGVVIWHCVAGQIAGAAIVPVVDASSLISAVNNATAGDVISLAPGIYDITGNINCDNPGTAGAPIVVRSAQLGDAVLRFDAIEGFKVSAPYWVFENLEIQGVCDTHSECEHGFHLFGAADFTTIRHCQMREYNAAIKSNGGNVGDDFVFPDDVLVEFNQFFNSTVRITSNPVTPIDVVGGRRWIVRANHIADFGKGAGNGISYAAFLKGNSKAGLFERNLVICERAHTGGIRLGLSFGGGGSGPPSICEEGTCTTEHESGVMRNNIIVNCPDDVGIYLNEALNVKILNNTIYNTTGIDVRFAASVAELRNNILSGAIRERDGGSITPGTNLTNVSDSEFRSWFLDPDSADFFLLDGTSIVDLGENLADVPDDFCANQRDDGTNDLGAVEYDGDGSCDTTLAGGGYLQIFSDEFESGNTLFWSSSAP